jgi:hypothetical protein
MKSKILQTVFPVLVVMTLTPVLGRAQAEINPDHFDTPNIVSTAGSKATANRSVSSFHGSLVLPFAVRCAGFSLPPGSYSMSVRRLGERDVITLTSKQNSVRLQAFGTGTAWRSSAQAPTVLVVERTGQRRTVRAIRSGESGMTGDLQTADKVGVSGEAELTCPPKTSPGQMGLLH